MGLPTGPCPGEALPTGLVPLVGLYSLQRLCGCRQERLIKMEGGAMLVATPPGAGKGAGLSVGLSGGAGAAAASSRELLGRRLSAEPGRRASRAGGWLQAS